VSTLVRYEGDADSLGREARAARVRPFLEEHVRPEQWVSRKTLMEAAVKAGLAPKDVDSELKKEVEDGAIDREDRSTETSRGKKAAHFRRVGPGNDDGEATDSGLPGDPLPLVPDSIAYMDRETETSGEPVR
jgi:hypothetical protein